MKHCHGDDADLRLLMAAVGSAFGGMTVEASSEEVSDWPRRQEARGLTWPRHVSDPGHGLPINVALAAHYRADAVLTLDRRDFRAMRPPHPRISGSGSYPTIYMSGEGPRYARSPKVLAQLARKTLRKKIRQPGHSASVELPGGL